MRNCFVLNCPSNYAHRKYEKTEPFSIFRCPNESLVPIWNLQIGRKDKEFTRQYCLCDKHFREEDIIRRENYRFPDGTVKRLLRKSPKLLRTAVPIYFANNPKPARQPEPDEPQPTSKEPQFVDNEPQPQFKEPQLNFNKSQPVQLLNRLKPINTCSLTFQLIENQNLNLLTLPLQENFNSVKAPTLPQNPPAIEKPKAVQATEIPFTITELHNRARDISLPDIMWGVHIQRGLTVFSHINQQLKTDKIVTFESSLYPTATFYGNQISIPNMLAMYEYDLPEIQTVREVEKLLVIIARVKPCLGYSDQQWHENCVGYIPMKFPRGGKLRCSHCRLKRRTFITSQLRMSSDEKLSKFKSKYKIKFLENAKLRQQVAKLKNMVKAQNCELKKMTKQKLLLIVN